MSQEALGIAGAVIGFAIGGPAGAQIGFIVGSGIGSVLFPQQVDGPRLNDIPIQTSRDGIPIPVGWGIIHVRGNIIQMNPLKEVVTTESQGKGGGAEVETTDYYRTFAIGICRSIEGPIAGIRRIWENDKLVYDARAHALYEYPNYWDWEQPYEWTGLLLFLQTPPPWFNAWMWQDVDPNELAIDPKDAALFAAHLMVYYGEETQLPDAELEAHWGADWTPAFRGLGYVVFNNYKLTTFGAAIPQYRFEVLVNGNGIITSRVYPLEAIDQIKIGCSAPVGTMDTFPHDAFDSSNPFYTASMRVALFTDDGGEDALDTSNPFYTMSMRLAIDTGDAGSDALDTSNPFYTATMRPALVTQIVPPEGLQINCSAPTGSMTAV